MVSQILPPGVVYHPADITAHQVSYEGYGAHEVPAYVARPAAAGPHPGLILVHGVHGFEEHMKDMARRFAVHGYACIVPALYCRDEFLSVVEEEDLSKASSWLSKRPNAQIEECHRSTLLCQLGNISYRLGGRKLQFDPQTETIRNDTEASHLAKRTGRKGYEIPDIKT